eukprot:scaffold26108_cov45-Phaeocystis_antarctica.AAC.1
MLSSTCRSAGRGSATVTLAPPWENRDHGAQAQAQAQAQWSGLGLRVRGQASSHQSGSSHSGAAVRRSAPCSTEAPPESSSTTPTGGAGGGSVAPLQAEGRAILTLAVVVRLVRAPVGVRHRRPVCPRERALDGHVGEADVRLDCGPVRPDPRHDLVVLGLAMNGSEVAPQLLTVCACHSVGRGADEVIEGREEVPWEQRRGEQRGWQQEGVRRRRGREHLHLRHVAALGTGRREREVCVGGNAADGAALEQRAGYHMPSEAACEAGVGRGGEGRAL